MIMRKCDRSPRRGVVVSSGVWAGIGMMVGAVVWFVAGWMAGYIFFYPPILFIIGVVALVRGLMGHEEE